MSDPWRAQAIHLAQDTARQPGMSTGSDALAQPPAIVTYALGVASVAPSPIRAHDTDPEFIRCRGPFIARELATFLSSGGPLPFGGL